MTLERQRYAAEVANLGRATEGVVRCATRSGLAPERLYGIELALEEAFVNVCSYAYAGGIGDVEVACGPEGSAFVLELRDWGEPFDVLSLPTPDTQAAMLDRAVGGLGIHFMRNVAERATYERVDGCNVLRLDFRPVQPSDRTGSSRDHA